MSMATEATMIRQPAVAGQFYSANSKQLAMDLAEMIPMTATKKRVVGIIAPHAGYVYSGNVAGAVYGAIEIPQTVIILGPNHHGYGSAAALYPAGEWLTPLGVVPINHKLSTLVKDNVPFVEDDTTAHQFEHSMEVQVPFLQYLQHGLSIVPICLGFSDFERCSLLGEGIARAVKAYGENVLIVASSDMTHYESADAARKKDNLAIAEVLSLNPEGLLNVCRKDHITMCGVIPSTVMLVAALELGAKKTALARYSTSGDVTGDNSQVVAYAAIEVF